MSEFETVIGLEVHLQLDTNTKIFCGCANEFGLDPNSSTCPVCLGLPGSLPVLNHQVLLYGVKVGLGLNCEINTFVKFDRKNYYYPDCPKNYQISQFDFPIAKNGHVMIPTENGEKRIGITRAHLEEDAGKLVHEVNGSLVDYNRTGTPLIEIVSEPDMRSPQEAYDYLTVLKLTLQYLNVSDCDMEKGSLRCDANVSIRPVGQKEFGTKTELKNMNSFRAVKTALEYEIQRQTQIKLAGNDVVQETLLWDEAKQKTVAMRSKEEAHDYRYFPEPDLVPFTLKEEDIEEVRTQLPEFPHEKKARFIEKMGVEEYDANILIQDQNIANFFEEALQGSDKVKKVSNWLNGPILKELSDRKVGISELKISPKGLVGLIDKVDDGTLSNLAAKDVLSHVLDSGKSVDEIISEKGLAQVSDDDTLESIIGELFAEHPNSVADIKDGKKQAIGFLIGQAMKKSQGKANPKKVGELINRRISNE